MNELKTEQYEKNKFKDLYS
jgi:hypothetical protein